MSYADDIIKWIGEGIDRCRIKNRQPKDFHCPVIKDYKAKLPCGLISIDGVVYNGRRLRYGFGLPSVNSLSHWVKITENQQSYFVTDTESNQQDYNKIRGLDLKQVTEFDTENYYYVEYGYIKTSFKDASEGEVVILYKKKPTDDEGYPLVPDIEELKEGLFWYVTGKLVFSGFRLADPRMDYDYCDKQATRFFRQAKNEIKRLGIEEKESMYQSWVTLIPPIHYYENFFINSEQPQHIVK